MIIKTNSKKRYIASFQWHLWFAWHPVILENEIVWLEKIWRRRQTSWYEHAWDHSVEKPAEDKPKE